MGPLAIDTTPRIAPTRFVLALGLVSLLADVVYEGARAVIGPYLGSLGASALQVGLITGLGEATALGARLVTGPLADRTRRWWSLTIAGYAMTAVAVPALALGGGLAVAAALVLLERLGKAVRTPARDVMISQAGARMGRGWAFAVHEATDQIGAVAGPLLVAGAVAVGGYALGFGMLALPGAAAIGVLLVVRRVVPHPERYEDGEDPGAPPTAGAGRLGRAFWTYAAFSGLVMLGFSTFALLGFHLAQRDLVAPAVVPVVYATAMAVDAGSALVSGHLYDRVGLRTLVALPVLAAAVPWLAFRDQLSAAWAGALVWGAALGLQEATLRAGVADLVPRGRRGTAYGIFTAAYGVTWLGGSLLVGALYGTSTLLLAAVITGVQAVALAVLLAVVLPSVRRGPAAPRG